MSRMSVARGPYTAALWLCVVSACSGSDGVQLFAGAAGHSPGGSSNQDAAASATGGSAEAGGSAGSSVAGGSAGSSVAGGPSNGAGGAGGGAPIGSGGASAVSLDGSAGTAMTGQVDAGRAADGSASGGSGGNADAATGATGGSADAGAKGGSGGNAGASGGSADAGAKDGSGGNAGATGGSGGNAGAADGAAGAASSDGGTTVADASSADATADVVLIPPPDADGPPLDCQSNRDCSSSQYCHKTSCAAPARGTCERRPSECPAGRADPVCGCDGVTYFDACLARSAGQSTSMDGACRETALHCRSALDLSCTSVSGYCAMLETDESACGGFGAPGPWVGVATGQCWVVPARCSSEEPASYISCGGRAGHCLTTCEAVKEGTQMFRDSACR